MKDNHISEQAKATLLMWGFIALATCLIVSINILI